VLLLAGICLMPLTACEREHREYAGAPKSDTAPQLSKLHPGAAAQTPPDADALHYERNAYHISQGGRLYRSYNCNGCHANGGGGIGPALMDDAWRYGGRIDQIYATIMQGRPNGMPAFRDKIAPEQAWQIAAYVRALSGNVPKDAAPSRRDGMASIPPLTRIPRQTPKNGDPSAEPEGP